MLTFGEHVELAVLRQQFDPQVRMHRLPRPLGQRRLITGGPGGRSPLHAPGELAITPPQQVAPENPTKKTEMQPE
jgi:hypothetical protein